MGKAEVGDSNMVILVEEDVGGFDVSVGDVGALGVKEFDTCSCS